MKLKKKTFSYHRKKNRVVCIFLSFSLTSQFNHYPRQHLLQWQSYCITWHQPITGRHGVNFLLLPSLFKRRRSLVAYIFFCRFLFIFSVSCPLSFTTPLSFFMRRIKLKTPNRVLIQSPITVPAVAARFLPERSPLSASFPDDPHRSFFSDHVFRVHAISMFPRSSIGRNPAPSSIRLVRVPCKHHFSPNELLVDRARPAFLFSTSVTCRRSFRDTFRRFVWDSNFVTAVWRCRFDFWIGLGNLTVLGLLVGSHSFYFWFSLFLEIFRAERVGESELRIPTRSSQKRFKSSTVLWNFCFWSLVSQWSIFILYVSFGDGGSKRAKWNVRCGDRLRDAVSSRR